MFVAGAGWIVFISLLSALVQTLAPEWGDVYVETFLVASWAEHLRQHDRFTQADAEVEAQVREHVEEEPVVEHFISA
jgi:hypothetical protein